MVAEKEKGCLARRDTKILMRADVSEPRFDIGTEVRHDTSLLPFLYVVHLLEIEKTHRLPIRDVPPAAVEMSLIAREFAGSVLPHMQPWAVGAPDSPRTTRRTGNGKPILPQIGDADSCFVMPLFPGYMFDL